MRTLRRILLGVLAAGVLVGQGVMASSATAETSDSGQVKIVPSNRVYGETRGELMTEMWSYFYQRRVGDSDPECFSIGRDDKVLVGPTTRPAPSSSAAHRCGSGAPRATPSHRLTR